LNVIEAAIRTKGRISDIIGDLGVPDKVLRHRLSLLRGLGLARTVTIIDPSRLGRSVQSTVMVGMRALNASALIAFEAHLLACDCVATASQIAGDYDYRLTTFHADWREAHQWVRALGHRPDVDRAALVTTRRVFGHELSGVPLH
jgi:hypothetical protein